MKNIFNTLLLLFLVTSCSKDDDAPVNIPPTAQIPAQSKFIETIDRDTDDIAIGYNSDKKINNIVVGHRIMYDITYTAEGLVDKIKVWSGEREGLYEFGHHPDGRISGCLVMNYNTNEISDYIGIVYNEETNSYNNWMYLYPDGSIRKVIIGGVEENLVYDTTKIGSMRNSNYEIVLYLMLIDRNLVLWPRYMGYYPTSEIITPQGAVAIDNRYDSQNFISSTHIDSTLNNLDAHYYYVQH